jgi:hypothetical protein
MGLGGVETEEELQTSLNLLNEWLNILKQEDDPDARHNSIELETLLQKRVILHKDRWFFPGRSRRMTFNQKATSLLESVN